MFPLWLVTRLQSLLVGVKIKTVTSTFGWTMVVWSTYLSYLRRARALSRSTSGCVQVTVSAIATMDSAPLNLISARKLALIMAQVYPTYGLLGRRLGLSHMLRLKQTSCLVPNGWSLLLSVLWPPFDLRSPIPVDKVDYILSWTTDI
jgi:hypothetical protein